MTPGSSRTASGVPSAISRPFASTTIRVASPMIAGQVVADHDEIDAFAAEVADAAEDALDQHGVDPAEGLVEQHQAGSQHQSPGELEQHPLPAGEVGRLLVGEVGDIEEIQVFLRPPDQGEPVVGAGVAGREARGEHILQRRHARKDPRDLEGAGNTGPGDLVR